jgi:hypothetical protein
MSEDIKGTALGRDYDSSCGTSVSFQESTMLEKLKD